MPLTLSSRLNHKLQLPNQPRFSKRLDRALWLPIAICAARDGRDGSRLSMQAPAVVGALAEFLFRIVSVVQTY